MFSTKTYKERRARLMQQVNSGLILLLGNEESSMNDADNTFHFRQDSTFLYFFGLNHAGLAGIVDIDEGKEYIFGNDLSIDDIVWMGYQPTIAQQAYEVGIKNTGSVNKLESFIKQAQKEGRKIHILPPYRPDNNIKLLTIISSITICINNSN